MSQGLTRVIPTSMVVVLSTVGPNGGLLVDPTSAIEWAAMPSEKSPVGMSVSTNPSW